MIMYTDRKKNIYYEEYLTFERLHKINYFIYFIIFPQFSEMLLSRIQFTQLPGYMNYCEECSYH